jgi:hypothetical protein
MWRNHSSSHQSRRCANYCYTNRRLRQHSHERHTSAATAFVDCVLAAPLPLCSIANKLLVLDRDMPTRVGPARGAVVWDAGLCGAPGAGQHQQPLLPTHEACELGGGAAYEVERWTR